MNLREKLHQRENIVLLAIIGLALLLRVALLDRNGFGNPYYAAATHSMLENFRNFFFVSHDPAGIVSVDKPPIALWIPALSAKIFGFNGLALLLPQALMGTLSVFLLYRLVRHGFSQPIALGAAFFLAICPMAVAIDRTNNMDTLLTLSLLLSSLAVIDAIQRDRLSSLLLAAFWVGVGFNAKMLEAWGLIPIFGLLYLFCARAPMPRRLGNLVMAGVVMVAVSLSWALLVDGISPDKRPHVGGSEKNSALELALGYNGFGRVFGGQGQIGPGAAMGRRANRDGSPGMPPVPGGAGGGQNGMPSFPGGMPGGQGGPPIMMGGPGGEGQASPLRLFRPTLASQVAWFLPIAFASLLFFVPSGSAAVTGRWSVVSEETADPSPSHQITQSPSSLTTDHRPPTIASLEDARTQLIALFWGWLLSFGAVFSMAQGIFHSYYLVVLGPPLAALTAIGAAELLRFRHKGAIAAAIGVTALWQIYLLRDYGWIPDVALIIGAVVLVALGLLTLAPKAMSPAIRVSGGLLLVAPLIWAITPLVMPGMGPMPSAGPMPNMARMRERMKANGMPPMPPGMGQPGMGMPPMPPGMSGGPGMAGMPPFPGGSGGGMPPFGGRGGPGGRRGGMPGLEADAKMTAFLKAHNGGERVLLLTQSAMEASPYIVAGLKAASFGGFLGRDPVFTPERLQKMAQSGEIRFVLLGGGGGPPMMRGGDDPNKAVKTWVEANGTPVSENLWREKSPGGFSFPMMGPPGMGGRGGKLYDLHPGVTNHAEARQKPAKPV